MARLHGLRAFLKAHPGLWVMWHSTHSSAVHLNTVICFEQYDCPASAVPPPLMGSIARPLSY